MTQNTVFKALKTVIDPELHVNIVDLGLIYKVEPECDCQQRDGDHIHILMTLTTPACPLAGTINQMINDAMIPLVGEDPQYHVVNEVTFDPPWTKDMMSEELKAEFGYDEWYD